MKIGTQLQTAWDPVGPRIQIEGSDPFAAYLAEQMAPSKAAAGVGDEETGDAAGSDADSIRKKGFTGFFKELREQRMEELRKKILADMGITEEDLARMSPDQRSTIEKMVNQELQRRLAAESAMENDNKKNGNLMVAGQATAREGLSGGFWMNPKLPFETGLYTGRQRGEPDFQF